MNKDLEELRNKNTETNNMIIQMNNTVKGINSRISEAEKQFSELKERMVEINAEEQNNVKSVQRTEHSLRDLWDQIQHSNI